MTLQTGTCRAENDSWLLDNAWQKFDFVLPTLLSCRTQRPGKKVVVPSGKWKILYHLEAHESVLKTRLLCQICMGWPCAGWHGMSSNMLPHTKLSFILEILKFLNYSYFIKIMTRKPKIGNLTNMPKLYPFLESKKWHLLFKGILW